MKNIETSIQHVTKTGTNLFAELGFPRDEARHYQAESLALIGQTLELREQLMSDTSHRSTFTT